MPPSNIYKASKANVTYDSSDTFLTNVNIESNIHRVHDLYMTQIQYISSIKNELEENYKLAVKNHDTKKHEDAINASMRDLAEMRSVSELSSYPARP